MTSNTDREAAGKLSGVREVAFKAWWDRGEWEAPNEFTLAGDAFAAGWSAALAPQREAQADYECVCGSAFGPLDEHEHTRDCRKHNRERTASAALAGNASAPVGDGRCNQCAVADQLQCVLDTGHEGDCMFAEWPYRAAPPASSGMGSGQQGLRERLSKLNEKATIGEHIHTSETERMDYCRICWERTQAKEILLATIPEVLVALLPPASKPPAEVTAEMVSAAIRDHGHEQERTQRVFLIRNHLNNSLSGK